MTIEQQALALVNEVRKAAVQLSGLAAKAACGGMAEFKAFVAAVAAHRIAALEEAAGVAEPSPDSEAAVHYEAGWAKVREALEEANPRMTIVLDGRARFRLQRLFVPVAAIRALKGPQG